MIISGGESELEIYVQERTPYFVKCFGCGIECSDWSKSSIIVKCMDWVTINGKLYCNECAVEFYETLKIEFENGNFSRAIILSEESDIFCYKFKIGLKAKICISRIGKAKEKSSFDSYYSECLNCIQGKFIELFLNVSRMLRRAKVMKSSNIIF